MPRHPYILALALVVMPLLFLSGYEVQQQDMVEKCVLCNSMHYTSERHRCIWGVTGKKVLRDEIVDSRVKTDFPELPCDHRWDLVSDRRKPIVDSWLFAAPSSPRSPGWFTSHPPLASYYDQEPRLREAVKAAMGRGVVTRQQMADWLADKEPGALSPAAEAEFEALSKDFW